MRILATAVLLLAVQTTVVSAGSTPPPATQESNAQNDPMVCETTEEIGSRLKKKRTCMRRSEWRAQRQENSQMINRTQVQRGLDPAN